MSQMNLTFDRLLYNELVRFYAENNLVEKTLALYHEMVDNGIFPDRMAYNSLIIGYLKKGKFRESEDLVDEMKAAGLVPKADTYGTMIKGLCNINKFSEGYIWFVENGCKWVFAKCKHCPMSFLRVLERKEGLRRYRESLRKCVSKD